MKYKLFIYLFLGIVIFVGLIVCVNFNNVNKDDKFGEDFYKIIIVCWFDWGEDYYKGFLIDFVKELGIDVKWDIFVAVDWVDKKFVLVVSGDLLDVFLGLNVFIDLEIV